MILVKPMRVLNSVEVSQIQGGGKNCECDPCTCCKACIGVKQEAFANKCQRSFLGILGNIPVAIFQKFNEAFNPWAKPSDLEF